MRIVSSKSWLLITAAVLIAVPAVAQEGPPPVEDRTIEGVRRAAPPPPPEPLPEETGPLNLNGGSSYGAFLAGRVALNRGDSAAAADYYAHAAATGAGQATPRERALSSAILNGDVALAASLDLQGQAQPALTEISRMAGAVQAMVTGRSRNAYRDIRERPIGAPHILAGRLISRWMAADAGQWDDAVAAPPAGSDALSLILIDLSRAQLLEIRRRYDEAEAIYRARLLDGSAAPFFREPYGAFLERRRRRDEAVAVYDVGLARGADSMLSAARARAASGGRAPPLPTTRQGASGALLQAARAANAMNAPEFAIAYLRLALALDSTNGESWLLLGEALDEIGMEPAAREAWARTPERSPAYLTSQVQLAVSLEEAGEDDQAIAVARAASARAGDDATAAYALAALLSGQERYAEALDVLDSPALAAQGDDWRVQFMRGAAFERLDRFAEAEAAFQQALTLAPDSPEVLNYLGYLWIDRGVRVEDGIAMVERAVQADPQSGAYQDSFGWGRYRQGRYEEAVESLERAVGLDAGSAVINDHLGDAYWQVGRTREAEYQWRRVLTLDPDDALRAQVEAKLAGGLSAVIAPSGL